MSTPDTPDLPAASDTGNSNSDHITSLTSFSLTGFATGGASVQMYNGASAIGSPCTANLTSGAYSCSLTGLASGTYTFSARASFGSGAAISSPSSLTVVVDSAAPVIAPAAAISVAENQTSITTIACSETCTLTMISGVDSAAVTFTPATGVVVFKVVPDFEAPNDVGSDQTYLFSIRGTDIAGNSTTVNYTVTIANVSESGSVSAPTISGAISKGVAIDISVTVNTAGKVRFFVGNKRINNCLARSTTGSYPSFTATCSWRPAVTGRQSLTATVTPTDNTFSASTSAPTTVQVVRRTTPR
jgi:hypothetical protein